MNTRCIFSGLLKFLLIGGVLSLFILPVNAQVTDRERPVAWEKLVHGGRFMDRFLPMPNLNGKTTQTWGAASVIPREINNGIEDKEWSYWGGNARRYQDGKYHLFVCRWPEGAAKGHMEWPNSTVVHAVADAAAGPYRVIQEVGKGHNPEWYITDDGRLVIYVIGGYYVAEDINGPWSYEEFTFETRDRKIIEGLSNLTFAKREDGSFIMICRGGGVWVSKDGISAWNQLTDTRIYPPVEGRFEDPLIWKTDVQYHLIVNDWLGRIAWYLRSKDGINWKVDPGEAYLPGIALNEDGTVEDWFKYERIKVLQDEYGRATQAHFAVIDTLKKQDLANDNHSSKHITIPLTVGRIIKVLNKKKITANTREIQVLMEAEPGFDPHRDVDLSSLRFGSSEVVNFGGGAMVKRTAKKGKDLIITFDGSGNGLMADDFSAKLLGTDRKGPLLFGYSRLPGVDYLESVLSARLPDIYPDGTGITVNVQNFGQVPSNKAKISIYANLGHQHQLVAKGKVPSLASFQDINLSFKSRIPLAGMEKQQFDVVINAGKEDEVILYGARCAPSAKE